MAITSESDFEKTRHHSYSQLKYGMVYLMIIIVVLLVLNLYSSRKSQQIFYQSKEAAMMDKARLAASEIAGLDVLNPVSVASVASQIDTSPQNRLVVTDQYGKVLYDSSAGSDMLGKYFLISETVVALRGNKVTSWQYHDGSMESRAAIPITAYRSIIGCVYMLETDTEQGGLIKSLQWNILYMTVILVVVVFICVVLFSSAFSRRLRRILTSIRVIRAGDYSYRVAMGGNDELTALGEEFNDLADRLQDSEQRRRQFVSDASHELKTPLASIKLLSDSILQNEMDPETTKEFVSDIGSEADRLNRMSQKLLSLTRLDAQKDSDLEIVYIAPTIEKVCRMLSLIAQDAEVSVHVEIRQDAPILIAEDDLYQILFNLMENGIKYNQKGGSLTVILARDGDNALIRVRDTGMGIPEESIPHIFDRFYRVDKARSRRTGGSGLGLAIVHDMVTRNRGRVKVTSTEGHGSEFTVEFPVFDIEEVSQ